MHGAKHTIAKPAFARPLLAPIAQLDTPWGRTYPAHDIPLGYRASGRQRLPVGIGRSPLGHSTNQRAKGRRWRGARPLPGLPDSDTYES